jgi:hypothetical protein
MEVVEISTRYLAEKECDIPSNWSRGSCIRGGTLALHPTLLIQAAAGGTLKRRSAALELAEIVALDLARRLIEIVRGQRTLGRVCRRQELGPGTRAACEWRRAR